MSYNEHSSEDFNIHLLGDLLLIRLRGVLVPAEQHLVKLLPAEKGQDLLKQVWTRLAETARPVMEAMVERVTGVKILTMHYDISTESRVAGEHSRRSAFTRSSFHASNIWLACTCID